MGLLSPVSAAWTSITLTLILSLPAVLSMDVRVESAVYGVVGESVKLWCGFTSPYTISKHITIDWSYRSQDGGPTVTIFHYQSVAYPSMDGSFKDRVTWEGDVERGDASISLTDLRLSDNGTLTCTVRNPPDVHGNFPQTKLTVTVQRIHFKFNTVLLLSCFVFIPSVLVSLVLLFRMRRAIRKDYIKSKKRPKKCSIEASHDCVYDNQSTNSLLHDESPLYPPRSCIQRFCLECADSDED
ncbi:myelin protein zero-like protein 3 [Bombina bombina]|uniref:myelin protein zero-like protein 3 n=1 Tax=Bombina bombina TaxID=8345 RepID=UPI00235ABB05|nr:myelin protein zero-like protein 3 [Bombina bombina]